MKKMLMMCAVVAAVMGAFASDPKPEGGPYKETVDGIEWTFMIVGDLNASVGAEDHCAVPTTAMGAITIPSVLGGRSVTGMVRGAFQYRVGLTSVTIPEGVRYINVNAFVGCSGMTSVSIPSSVKWIEGYAFSGCSGLTRVTIPSGVESIGERAFLDCTSLTSVLIPSSVTSIGTWAFYGCSGLGEGVVVVDGCAFPVSDSSPATIEIPEGTRLIADACMFGNTNLTSVTMPDGMAIIGKNAFYGCYKLSSVSIPKSVMSIGLFAFYGCSGLGDGIVIVDDCVLTVNGPCPADVDIPDGTRLIADYVFAHHDEIKSIAIPKSVAAISDQMCDGCEGLTNVTMASGVTTIGRMAFWDCDGLTSATIPSSVTSIGDNAFGDCRELNSVDFEGAPPDGVKWAGFKQDAAIRYNVDYYEQWLPVIEECGWTNATPYVPPKPEGGPYMEEVDGIEWTFMVDANLNASVGVGSLSGKAVPQSTTGAIAIPEVLGGRQVTSIGGYAFKDCTSLTSVVIPSDVTDIGDWAFYNCSSLAGVTIPEGVIRIGGCAFERCAGLASVVIPSRVAIVGDFAFSKCSGLESVTLSEGVTLIGSNMFSDCINLTSVTIPPSARSIGSVAFARCTSLTSVTIPSNVTSIGSYAFSGCSSLTDVTIPSSVTSIGNSAFYGCSGLSAVDFEGAPPTDIASAGFKQDAAIRYNGMYYAQWEPVVKQCGWTNAKPYAPVPFPEGGPYKEMVEGIEWTFTVTNGEASVGTGSSSGTAIPAATTGEIAIPTELGGRIVTSIGQEAFYCCKAITGATIPSSITSIGKSAFGKCIKLEGVMIPASVTNIGICAFSGDCESLKWIDVEAESAYYSAQDGVLFNKDKTALIQYPGAKAGTYTIPESVKHIGPWAFQWCHNLERLTVPTNVVSMAESAFFTGVYTFAIDFEGAPPKGIRDAFINSASPIRYNIAYRDEWEQVAKDCQWSNAKHYYPVPLPEGGPYKEKVEGIEWTFMVTNGEACVGTGKAAAAIPTTTKGAIRVPSELGGRAVTGIGNSAFSMCSDLTGVTIPEGVTSLGTSLFYCDFKITELTVPASVTNITVGAFYACVKLQDIHVADGNQHYVSIDGVVYTKDGTSLLCCVPTKTSVSILASVTNICSLAFGECRELESITLPPNLTTLGYNVFYNCKITELTFPSSLVRIGGNLFPGCSLLTTFYFKGAPPERIEYGGFKTDATIKYSGQYFNAWERVIEQCGWTNTAPYNPSGEPYPDGGLYAEMADGVRWLFMVGNGEASVGVSSSMYGRSAIPQGTVGDIVVPDLLGGRIVTDVSGAAFIMCSNLTSVTLSSIVTNVNAGAFGGCCSLQSIEVAPDNMHLAALDGVLFDKAMKNLVAFPGGLEGEYTIPSGVTNVYGQAFFSCQGLTKITLPLSVSIVGSWAFGNCTNLNAVDFECAPPKWVEYSDINRDAAIRYNAAYQAEWEPVVEACGWTNAKPYYPFAPATPVISPESGTTFEGSSLSVSMTCASEEATIHYTTDGSEPTMESPVYKRFKVYGKTTVKAIAFFEDGTPSEMAVAEYAKGVCDDPEIEPPDGTVFEHSGQKVSITRYAEDGVVRYTTDGSDPTEDSPAYAGPFTIDETTTIRAKAFGDQYFDSGVVTATLTRVWVKVATPVITAPTSFTGSQQKIEISCATEGATVRYTTNGQDPNSHSPKYTKPFYVTDTTTVKAYATKADYVKSDIAACTIAKVWAIGDTMGKPDHAFSTGGDLGFVRVEDATATLGESMQSGEIKNSQTSILSTVVVGPGTLTFKWKTSCEHDPEGSFEWDHAEFLVDGKIKGQLDDETEWIEVSQRIEGDGEHTVIWLYVKDDVEEGGEDCLWVSDYVWETDYTETKTTEVPVPYDWLQEKSRDIVDEYDNYEKVAKQKAYNPRYTVEQCYVAGLDPESTTNEFKMAISMEGGLPTVTWDPDLGVLREYKVWGRESLMSGDWVCPTNSTHRFFKVTVEMK